MEDRTLNEVLEIGRAIFETRFDRKEEFAPMELIHALDKLIARQEPLLREIYLQALDRMDSDDR